ncbi:MAG TPA: ABC transporter ATP-binding protein [Caulobacteraceae bacterium]|nr:ABC transporter ATP-binding protein [Caulobacteraceae bacterium]
MNPGRPGPINTGPILEVQAVRHAFGAHQALKGVSLEVTPGEIYALLGPNGAGKTTLVRAICGRLKPDSGEVRLAGRDPFSDGEARAALGLAPQALALYPQLTVAENLQTFASLAGLRGRAVGAAVARAMAVTKTAERADALVRHLSGGLQRRVNIAAAILADPRLLVLDEPTVGVDQTAKLAIGEALTQLKAEGVGILLVTHDLDQAGGLADRVGFLRDGEKVLEGAPDALIAEAFGDQVEIEVDIGEANAAEAGHLAQEGLSRDDSGVWRRLAPDGYVLAAQLGQRLKSQGLTPREIRVRRPSLEQLFALVAEARRAA